MTYDIDKEVLSNLKNKTNAIIEKGNEFSEDLSIDEQYSIMKNIIFEGINKATLNIFNDEEVEFTKEEIQEKKKELEQFVYEYFDKRFSKYKATVGN
jgi:hypothetical protein